jgi:hypothetical protein
VNGNQRSAISYQRSAISNQQEDHWHPGPGMEDQRYFAEIFLAGIFE